MSLDLSLAPESLDQQTHQEPKWGKNRGEKMLKLTKKS